MFGIRMVLQAARTKDERGVIASVWDPFRVLHSLSLWAVMAGTRSLWASKGAWLQRLGFSVDVNGSMPRYL